MAIIHDHYDLDKSTQELKNVAERIAVHGVIDNFINWHQFYNKSKNSSVFAPISLTLIPNILLVLILILTPETQINSY